MGFRALYMGTAEIACAPLKALNDYSNCEIVGVLTQPDRPRGRSMKMQSSAVKQSAEKLGLAVLQPPTLRSDPARRVSSLHLPLSCTRSRGRALPRIWNASGGDLSCDSLEVDRSVGFRSELDEWRLARDRQPHVVVLVHITEVLGLDADDQLIDPAQHDALGDVVPQDFIAMISLFCAKVARVITVASNTACGAI